MAHRVAEAVRRGSAGRSDDGWVPGRGVGALTCLDALRVLVRCFVEAVLVADVGRPNRSLASTARLAYAHAGSHDFPKSIPSGAQARPS